MATSVQNDNRQGQPLKILIFSASLRTASLNTRLAKLAAGIMEKSGVIVDLASMSEFDCPSYNGEVEEGQGIPAGAIELNKRLLENDAFVIAAPEYNGSVAGNLKNVIDWVSRFRPQPFYEKNSLLMSASPSMAGGNRGLWSLRIPLEHLGSPVMPNMFSLAMAHQAFNEDGSLVNPTLAKRFEENITSFLNLVEATVHYPCMKKAWVEFLGEQPDPVTERVE